VDGKGKFMGDGWDRVKGIRVQVKREFQKGRD
jgi:hypothetical protein